MNTSYLNEYEAFCAYHTEQRLRDWRRPNTEGKLISDLVEYLKKTTGVTIQDLNNKEINKALGLVIGAHQANQLLIESFKN